MFREMRRKRQQVENAECLEVLRTAKRGVLAVLVDAGVLGERDVVVGGEAALLPGAVTVVACVAVIGRPVGEAEVAPIQVLLLHESRLLMLVTFDTHRL